MSPEPADFVGKLEVENEGWVTVATGRIGGLEGYAVLLAS
jgi:hypothetical protein